MKWWGLLVQYPTVQGDLAKATHHHIRDHKLHRYRHGNIPAFLISYSPFERLGDFHMVVQIFLGVKVHSQHKFDKNYL